MNVNAYPPLVLSAAEKLSERTRAPLPAAIQQAFVPVTHAIGLQPE